MEGLLLIFGELLFLLLAPVFAFFGAIFGAIAQGILELIFGAAALRRAKKPKDDAKPKKPSWLWKNRHRVMLYVSAPFTLVFVLALIADTFFFDRTTRMVMDRIEEKTGFEINYATVDGSLRAGQLRLGDLTVQRTRTDEMSADLAVASVDVDIAMLSLIGDVRIETLAISGVRGDIQTVERPEGSAQKPKTARRAFSVTDLVIEDVDLVITPDTRPDIELKIETVSAAPFRSRNAVFDLFFRSNLIAEVNGADLLVETEVIAGDGRRTAWRFEDIPVATAGALIGKAPFTWFDGGMISARVDDEWKLDDRSVDMDWSLQFRDMSVGSQEDMTLSERGVIKFVSAVFARRDHADISFTLQLEDGAFSGNASEDAKRLFDKIVTAVKARLADPELLKRTEAEPAPEPEKPGALDRIKNRLRDLRGTD